jgi:hypothetical protein
MTIELTTAHIIEGDSPSTVVAVPSSVAGSDERRNSVEAAPEPREVPNDRPIATAADTGHAARGVPRQEVVLSHPTERRSAMVGWCLGTAGPRWSSCCSLRGPHDHCSMTVGRLQLLPITIQGANGYVARWHRHHAPVRSALFAVAAQRVGALDLCGVAIIGRPKARALQDGRTCEVVRLASDGSDNVCSFLYEKARRAAQALGFTRCKTYTPHRQTPHHGQAAVGTHWRSVVLILTLPFKPRPPRGRDDGD